RREQRLIYRRKVAAARSEGVRDMRDGGGRRVIGDKVATKLGGNEMRRSRPRRDIPQNRLPLLDAVVRIALAEHDFRARLVQLGSKHKLTGRAAGEPAGLATDRPPRDHFSEGGHVSLRIAAADT